MKQFDKLNAFLMNKDGAEQVGVADVELPDLEMMNDKMSGAGIAGEVEMPTVGQYQSMKIKISWRIITKNALDLSAPKAHDLEFVGSQQIFDAGIGSILQQSVKINTRVLPKKIGLGKMNTSSKTGTSNEFEAIYLKLTIDDKPVIEIDKFNSVTAINGVDYMAAVRAALGK